jgi:hypothetical protein
VRYWNTKRQGFPPECEGFSLNSACGLPNQRFSAGFSPGGIITIQAQELKVLYLLPTIKHP